MTRIALLLPIALAACAPPAPLPSSAAPVRPGLEVFLDDPPAAVRGKRVGLVTNHTALDRAGRSAIDLLHAAPGFELVALYAPEHGIRGGAAAGEHVESGRDEKTGLPIHSLYGATRKPTPEMLEGIEALVFDIQDVGARQYTYPSTMALAMEAAAEKGIPFLVLDRPNPVGGEIVEGNLMEERYESFVGFFPVPSRHGLTVGELARFHAAEARLGVEPIVVPVEGWRRDLWLDETGLPWVNPSPNLRRFEALVHYPGTVYLETVNLLERGTDLPFEQTGAPWLRAREVVDSMNAMRLPGVRFEEVRLAVSPSAAKYPGQTVPGVRYRLTDRETYRPVRATLLLIDLVRRLHPADFRWTNDDQPAAAAWWIERLGGTDRIRRAIEGGTLPALLDDLDREAEAFRRAREPYLLYR